MNERRLIELWERHMRLELIERDATATVATMSPADWVNHVPVRTGGCAHAELLEFSGRSFIPKMPADTRITIRASRRELIARAERAGGS